MTPDQPLWRVLLTNPWVWGGLLAIGFVVVAWLVIPRRRSFLRLLPGLFLIVVPVILVVVAIGSVVASQAEVDLRIRQAAIAAVVVASGWVVSFLLQEYRRADERDERIRDMHRAIYADVASYIEALQGPEALSRDLQVYLDRLEVNPSWVPVLSPPRHSKMFTALSGQIHVLPRVTIDLIVLFYSQIETIAAFVDNMNGDRFTALEADRRAVAYRDYFAMLEFAYRLGDATQRVVSAYDKEGAAAAKTLAESLRSEPTLNNPGADPSGR